MSARPLGHYDSLPRLHTHAPSPPHRHLSLFLRDPTPEGTGAASVGCPDSAGGTRGCRILPCICTEGAARRMAHSGPLRRPVVRLLLAPPRGQPAARGPPLAINRSGVSSSTASAVPRLPAPVHRRPRAVPSHVPQRALSRHRCQPCRVAARLPGSPEPLHHGSRPPANRAAQPEPGHPAHGEHRRARSADHIDAALHVRTRCAVQLSCRSNRTLNCTAARVFTYSAQCTAIFSLPPNYTSNSVQALHSLHLSLSHTDATTRTAT